MIKSGSMICRIGCRMFVVLFPALLLLATAGLAQNTPENSSQQQTSERPKPARDQSRDFNSQEVRESREAAGEEKDENDELKKSPAVRLVARATGMSLEQAYWLCLLLNFVVIAGAIVWLSRSRLPGMFRNRTASIQRAMEEARKASQEANQRLADIEARLAKLDTEIASIQTAAEEEGAREEARIKAASEEDARKIVEAAEQEVAAAAKAARRDLKAFAANLAVSLAQKQIRVDSATDEALVRSFADQLGTGETNGEGPGKDGR